MVWSDPEIKSLSKNFVTVADEVYMLYPEDQFNLNRVKDRPDHQFFKRFGESMPKGDWNHPGTKQGIYMMGPDAEYLEGRFAASGDAGDIRARLKRALDRWEVMARQKGYKNLPIPDRKWSPPPGIAGSLILRVNLRDLPRGEGDKSGSRREDLNPNPGYWLDFTRWAWNENWIALESPLPLVTRSREWQQVSSEVISRIAREVMVDNVRGQAPIWPAGALKDASLSMRLVATREGVDRIEYSGKVRLEEGSRAYAATLYGIGEWERGKGTFRALDLVAAGMRRGASRFNQRERDLGPAPMGVSLSLHR